MSPTKNKKTKDFDRFVMACTYPGVIDPGAVESHLRDYLKALGVERKIVRLDANWSLDDHPDLAASVDAVLADFAKRVGVKPPSARDARAALAAIAARDARDAIDARDARDAIAARDASAASAALDAIDARDARAARKRFAAWCIQGGGWRWWRWELSWVATVQLGAGELGKTSVTPWSKPLFEAFIAGAWLLHWTERTVFWVSKPAVHVEEVDGRRRLHCADAAAIDSDIDRLYFWHGVMVPAFVVTRPDWITGKHILEEPNAEVRRVMIERVGFDRFLQLTSAKQLQADDYGELFRIELQDDEPVVLVRVVNSTPEQDGSSKKYVLRVPPNITSAREAVAWSFNVPTAEYAPGQQT